MELVLKQGFCEISREEMQAVAGGDFLGFLGGIYDKWCDIWHDFGSNLYYMVN